MIFIDGTHIKVSANKKKFQKERAVKVYSAELRREVNAEREQLGKKPIEDDDADGGATVEKTGSTTDPDSGMFVKGEHKRQFAYEAHTACDKNGFVLGVEAIPAAHLAGAPGFGGAAAQKRAWQGKLRHAKSDD